MLSYEAERRERNSRKSSCRTTRFCAFRKHLSVVLAFGFFSLCGVSMTRRDEASEQQRKASLKLLHTARSFSPTASMSAHNSANNDVVVKCLPHGKIRWSSSEMKERKSMNEHLKDDSSESCARERKIYFTYIRQVVRGRSKIKRNKKKTNCDGKQRFSIFTHSGSENRVWYNDVAEPSALVRTGQLEEAQPKNSLTFSSSRARTTELGW